MRGLQYCDSLRAGSFNTYLHEANLFKKPTSRAENQVFLSVEFPAGE